MNFRALCMGTHERLLVGVSHWCECCHSTYWKNVINAEHFPKCLLLSISLEAKKVEDGDNGLR